jgi:transposase-like protein
VPTPYPKEFRAHVVAVARQGDKSRAQVARSFGISESCLARWFRMADRDDGEDGVTATEASGSSLEVENRELRKRTKQLEQETKFCAGRPLTLRATPPQNCLRDTSSSRAAR